MKRYIIVIIVLIVTSAMLDTAGYTSGEQKEPTVPMEKIVLSNGRDFTGWKLFVPDANCDVTKMWSVKDGVICCEGQPAGYMRTEKDYADYLLHVEWRWAGDGGNSGVLLHMSGQDKVWPRSLESQLMSGNAGDFWVIDGVEIAEHAGSGDRVKGRRLIKLKESSERVLGQWNAYDIVCKDDWVVVLVNGVLQNVGTGCSERSGKICLQSEGAPIEFRNIYIEPLK